MKDINIRPASMEMSEEVWSGVHASWEGDPLQYQPTRVGWIIRVNEREVTVYWEYGEEKAYSRDEANLLLKKPWLNPADIKPYEERKKTY